MEVQQRALRINRASVVDIIVPGSFKGGKRAAFLQLYGAGPPKRRLQQFMYRPKIVPPRKSGGPVVRVTSGLQMLRLRTSFVQKEEVRRAMAIPRRCDVAAQRRFIRKFRQAQPERVRSAPCQKMAAVPGAPDSDLNVRVGCGRSCHIEEMQFNESVGHGSLFYTEFD